MLVPANAFGDEYAAENPETLPGTLLSIKHVERDEATGEERRIWEVQYETGPWETDESFFDAEPELPAPVPPSPVVEGIDPDDPKAAEIRAAYSRELAAAPRAPTLTSGPVMRKQSGYLYFNAQHRDAARAAVEAEQPGLSGPVWK